MASDLSAVSPLARTPEFAVLLASFDGILWINEQVTSILQQESVNVTIFASDDASQDGTREWLERRSAIDSRVKLLPKSQRFGGAAKNFFRLIRDVEFSHFDYVALADQDDIWMPGKLRAAHNLLGLAGTSAYSSNVTAFWSDGRQKITEKACAQRDYDFLFESAGPGCTYVFNANAAGNCKSFLIANWDKVNAILLHDWFLYAWFRASKLTWCIDKNSYVQYRQHHANQVGVNFGFKAAINRFKLMQKKWYRREVGKIASLSLLNNDAVASDIGRHGGAVSLLVLLRYGRQFRRRTRDRFYLWIFVIMGIY